MERLHKRGGNHNPLGKKAPAERTAILKIRCTQDFKDKALAGADARKMTLTDLVEAAIEAFLQPTAAKDGEHGD